MSLGKRLLALLAGGSAVGAGVAGAAVTSQEATAPDPIDIDQSGGSLDIEGERVRVDAKASPLDDLLDSANTAGSPDTPGTEDRDTAGTNSANTAGSPDTAGSADTAGSPDTAGTEDRDTAATNSANTAGSDDSGDNSGPGSGDEADDDNSGSGSGDDNSGSGS